MNDSTPPERGREKNQKGREASKGAVAGSKIPPTRRPGRELPAVYRILDRTDITGSYKRVLVAIASYADPDGTNAEPSYGEGIMRRGEVSESTGRRRVRELEADSELTVEYKAGRYGSNRYTVMYVYERRWEDPVTQTTGSDEPSPGHFGETPGQNATPTRSNRPLDPVTQVTPNHVVKPGCMTMSSDQEEGTGQEKDHEQQKPPAPPAEPETSRSQDVAEDNGSNKEEEALKFPALPAEVQAVLAQFPGLRQAEVGVVWRHRLAGDTSAESIGSLVAYCRARIGSPPRAPMRSYEAAEQVFGVPA